jgi:hypothetical protein
MCERNHLYYCKHHAFDAKYAAYALYENNGLGLAKLVTNLAITGPCKSGNVTVRLIKLVFWGIRAVQRGVDGCAV